MNAILDSLSLTRAGVVALRTVPKSWGREEIFVDEPYCVKKLIYTHVGVASSLHYHERKHETFVVLSGVFTLITQERADEGVPVTSTRLITIGDLVVLPPGVAHRLRLREAQLHSRCGVILECSTADDPQDCVRLVASESPRGIS